MARKTFFSFHYKPDVRRAWIARNSWVTKDDRQSAGFFDSSVFERAKRESPDALKRFLIEGLKNTTVTCVLVGSETSLRQWVRFEIFRSFVRGNGLFAIRIHNIKNTDGATSQMGSNPFESLAFKIDDYSRLKFREYKTSGWSDSSDVGSMRLSDVAYDLGNMANNTLSCLFPIYDWVEDDGYNNMGSWIETAAITAGK